ncbi:MAG: hypothetical protein ACI4J1_01045 [Ruminiclostridium sp.]
MDFNTLAGASRSDIINMISDGGESETAVSEAEFALLDAELTVSAGAFEGGRLRGCVLNSVSGNEALLLAMGADSEEIQKRVLDYAFQLLKERGIALYKAEAYSDMPEKTALLKEWGFAVIEEKPGERYTPLGAKRVTVIKMEKTL